MKCFSQHSVEQQIPRDYPRRDALLAATNALFRDGALSVEILYVAHRLTLDVVFPQENPKR